MAAHLTDIAFSQLNLNEQLQDALKAANLEFCTPIQAKTLPILLENKDCAGQAQTGTGKTLAFLLGALSRLLKDQQETIPGKPKALILAPTRELALQIEKDAKQLTQHLNINTALVYGGKGYEQQKAMFEKPVDILIGTPGRIIDFFKQKVFNFRQTNVLVLDEADRMFDMGFISDVRFILRRLPNPDKRLSMLFSATMSQKVMELAYEHMHEAQTVKIESESPAVDRIDQTIYHPANSEKIPLLVGLIQQQKPERSIIFTNTKQAAINIWEYLEGNNLKSAILSGDIKQNRREKLLEKFHQGEYSILVATDVASRGLHIPDVSHVFNFDLPDLGEDYVHRIGRTARAGKEGHAISFACEDYAMNLMDIEMYIEKSIPTVKITNDLIVELAPPVKMKRDKPKTFHKKHSKPRSHHHKKPFKKNKTHHKPKKD